MGHRLTRTILMRIRGGGPVMKQAMRVMVCAGSVAGGVAMAADVNPRAEAMDRSAAQVDALVAGARDGRLAPAQLRTQRRRVEARLAHELDTMPLELKPGDLRAITQSRAELNQSLMVSQEFEYFGAVARPEWGWYPQGVPHTGGSSRTAGGADVGGVR